MTQMVTFHLSWPVIQVIIAVKIDLAMMKRLLMCHREERSDVAISLTYLQAPLEIASLRSQ